METYIRSMWMRWAGTFACLLVCSHLAIAAKAPQDNWYYDGVFTTNFTGRKIYVMTNGNIVTERFGDAVAEIRDDQGNFITNWGENLSFPTNVLFQNAYFMGLGPSNAFYVQQQRGGPGDFSKLHIFDQYENHVTQLWENVKAVTGSTINSLNVASDADGNVYSAVLLSAVAPVPPPYVEVNSPSGTQLSTWQPFSAPSGWNAQLYEIAVAPGGRVFVVGGAAESSGSGKLVQIASFAQDGTPLVGPVTIPDTDSLDSSGVRGLFAGDIVVMTFGQSILAFTLDLEFLGYIGTPDNPLAQNPNLGTGSSSNGDVLSGHNGSLWISMDQGGYEGVFIYRNGIRTMLPPGGDVLPAPQVVSIAQRPSSGIIDIDYKIVDPDDATTHTAVIALPNGSDAVADIVLINTFVDGTQTNKGANIATDALRRLSWDADADLTNDFVNMVFRVLAKDDQGLLDLHFITVPAEGVNPSFLINRTPLVESDFQQAWVWLLASGDASVTRLGDGSLQAVGGAFNGQILVDGTGATTSSGRAFLFDRLNVRAASVSEETQAREAGTPGIVNQFEPRNRVGERPKQVNAYGVDTGDWGVGSGYVVPLP